MHVRSHSMIGLRPLRDVILRVSELTHVSSSTRFCSLSCLGQTTAFAIHKCTADVGSLVQHRARTRTHLRFCEQVAQHTPVFVACLAHSLPLPVGVAGSRPHSVITSVVAASNQAIPSTIVLTGRLLRTQYTP
eukprot:2055717-Alexandrium_andersonii.AAC.1